MSGQRHQPSSAFSDLCEVLRAEILAALESTGALSAPLPLLSGEPGTEAQLPPALRDALRSALFFLCERMTRARGLPVSGVQSCWSGFESGAVQGDSLRWLRCLPPGMDEAFFAALEPTLPGQLYEVLLSIEDLFLGADSGHPGSESPVPGQPPPSQPHSFKHGRSPRAGVMQPAARARKGGGTFFTPRALCAPTVRRTLEPLCYFRDDHGLLRARSPEVLLELKICDPAMGYGAFLIEAQHFVAGALLEALHQQGRIQQEGGGWRARIELLEREPEQESVLVDPVRFRDLWVSTDPDSPAGARDLGSQLRSMVTQRCLFGVDLDGTVVALARTALWLDLSADGIVADRIGQNLVHANSLIDGDIAASATEHTHPAGGTGSGSITLQDVAIQIGTNGQNVGHVFDSQRTFSSIFKAQRAGFDAVIGNPPWDVYKPDAKSYFSRIDIEFNTLSRHQADIRRAALMAANPGLRASWEHYLRTHQRLTRWISEHYPHQGRLDLSGYKLFLERAIQWTRPGGRVGLIVPSSLCSDQGARALRKLLLEECQWEWLFGFENRQRIFDIDARFKFSVVILTRGGRTEQLCAAFMRRSLSDWEHAERHCVRLTRAQLLAFSPRSLAILEVDEPRDCALLERMYGRSRPLFGGPPGAWAAHFSRELDMTLHALSFTPRAQLQAQGYVPDLYGHWLRGPWRRASTSDLEQVNRIPSRDGRCVIDVEAIEGLALPLYEGRMLGPNASSAKGWVSGHGRRAIWRSLEPGAGIVEPQFLVETSRLAASRFHRGLKLAYLAVGSATNARTMTCALLEDFPCGNAVPVLQCADPSDTLALSLFMGSLVFDYALRRRLCGNNLNRFLLEEMPVGAPLPENVRISVVGHLLALNFPHVRAAPRWLEYQRELLAANPDRPVAAWRSLGAHNHGERLRRRCILDALAAHFYGLDEAAMRWLLRDCALPTRTVADPALCRKLELRGLWRLERQVEPELRHTVLTLVAFLDLQARGPMAFLEQNGGRGWELPETLKLADLELGSDARARAPQPVAGRLLNLEPRTGTDPGEEGDGGWASCALHASRMEAIRCTIDRTLMD